MTAHRWWRVSNIVTRLKTGSSVYGHVAELRFINKEGIDTYVRQNAISESAWDNSGAYQAYNAFDNNPNTIAHQLRESQGWWIGYIFDEPVEVTTLHIRMRADDLGQEWQAADVEYSDDGVIWHYQGSVFPLIGAMDTSLKVAHIIFVDRLQVNQPTNTIYLPISASSGNGIIVGQTQEQGIPYRCEVMLYDYHNKHLVDSTWSDKDGNFRFVGLNKHRRYYLVALHHGQMFNLVGQDGVMAQ